MKTILKSLTFVVAVGLSCCLCSSLLADEEMEIDLKRSVPKSDYYLILGADIAQTNKNAGTLVGVKSSTLLIRSSNNGRTLKLPSDNLKDIRINRDLKLSPTFVEIDRLVAERSFTLENDPNRKWAKAVNQASNMTSYLGDRADIAASELRKAGPPISAPVMSSEDIAKNEAREKIAQAYSSASSTQSDAIIYKESLRGAAEIDSSAFDALKITFQAKPSRPLKDVYAVTIAEYRGPDEPVSARHTWIQFSEIGDIQPKITVLRLRGGGLIPGYVLLNLKVHLYENGVELATNASDQCVPLNWAGALQYVRVAYLSSHKTDTLPASVAAPLLPTSFGGEISPGDLKRRVRVTIDKEGSASEFHPLDGDGPLSSAHLFHLRQLGFLPALQQGKPVDGKLELSLAELLPKASA